MIWVKYQTREDAFVSLEITGHADFREHGQDMICAAVSLTGTGLLNAIDEMEPDACELIKEDNRIYVKVLHDSEQLQTILMTSYHIFKTLEYKFRIYVRVRKTEVKS